MSFGAKPTVILLCLLVCLLANRAGAAQSSKLFPVTEMRLTNGLRVLTLEDHSTPLVAVQVWYHVGSANEIAGRRGFAHLFEHMMFRGTDRLGPTDHMDLIKSVGGTCNAFTDFDATCYHQTLPAQQLELALWLESERMAFLAVDKPAFTTERRVVEEERRMNLNQPYGDLPDRGLPLIFGQHPYASSPLGTIRDLRQATPADVHAWWKAWYTPNNATLVISGDFQTQTARALIERYFSWISAVPPPRREVPLVPPFPQSQQIELKLENAPTPGVGIFWRTVPEGHADALPLEVLATILGGGQSSRLHRRLVSDGGLAVMVVAMQYGLARAGGFGTGAALPPLGGDPARTLAGLRAEVDSLVANGVTEQELEKARNQAISKLTLEAATLDGKARTIGRAAVVGVGVDELNSRLDRLRQLTRQELVRVAQTYLDPKRAMTVSVPGSSMLGQLSRFLFGVRNAEEQAPIADAPDTRFSGRPGVTRPANLPIHPPVNATNSPMPRLVVQEHRLTNGLRVLISANRQGATVHAVLALPFGSWAEQKPGAAALALATVSKGTEEHDQQALAEEIERHGIQLHGLADQDDSRIELSCLSDHAEMAFSLLAEVVTRPTFPECSVKTAAAQALTGLAIADSEPQSVADREFRRQLFVGHAYGRRPSGEAKDISALRSADLTDFWRQIARPEEATLIIAGALTPERALKLSEQFFSDWTNPEKASDRLRHGDPAPISLATQIVLVDWPGAGQSEIRVGGVGIAYRDPDKPIADLTSSYFGGSFGSRLMKTIRVGQGGTYGAYGGFYEHRFAGTFKASTFTRTSTTAETLRMVLSEVRGLVNRPPTAEELALHRRFFLGSGVARFETSEQVANQFARIALNGLPLDDVQRTCDVIGLADAARCEMLVRRVIDPERLLIIVVGDAKVIGDSLREIAPVTVLDREGRPLEKPKPAG